MAFKDLERLQSILECPRCESPLVFSDQEAHCLQCQQEIRTIGRCMIFIDDDLPGDFDQPDYVSSNPYTWNSLQLIEENMKGVVLDLGAGQPDHDFPNVVQAEIRKYPATDIVITEGRLPFQDNSIDGIISEAVLEHVQDPFFYAQEIHRVLKPGGRCVLHAAFLQPLHGYPNHYFNTTHSALELLFCGFNIKQLRVGPHQHPWITLRWMLNSYIQGMESAADQQAFRDQTVAELEARLIHMEGQRIEIKKNPDIKQRGHDLFTFNQDFADELAELVRISPEAEKELAAGFELIAEKDAGSGGRKRFWQGLRRK